MFQIDGQTIHISRGDEASFNIQFEDENHQKYMFQVGDEVRFTVARNFKSANYVFQKTIVVQEESDTVVINLSSDDTLFGEASTTPQTFEYDIVLNNAQSVICYDCNGAPKLISYPRSQIGEVQ